MTESRDSERMVRKALLDFFLILWYDICVEYGVSMPILCVDAFCNAIFTVALPLKYIKVLPRKARIIADVAPLAEHCFDGCV